MISSFLKLFNKNIMEETKDAQLQLLGIKLEINLQQPKIM